jgi:ligand-binding sensor domain-containing protein
MRAVSALILVFLGVSPLVAQGGSRLWRPDERVLISDFSHVNAVAVSRELLYVVTPSGIGMYDRRFFRWEPPVTSLDGYVAEPTATALVDPVDRSLWMGTTSGILRYDPALRRFERHMVPGGVFDLMFDGDNTFSGIYLRSRSGWQVLQRGSHVPFNVTRLPPANRQIRSTRVAELFERLPHLVASTNRFLMDQRMRRVRFTSGGIAPDNEDVYLGTDGAGVVKVDIMTDAEPMPFGLLAPSVGAVALAEAGVWVGTGRAPARMGFSYVGKDLQRYVIDEGPTAAGYRFQTVYDLLLDGETLWAGTDAGLWAVELGGRARRVGSGLIGSVERVLAVAGGETGVWAGTERGLVYVDEERETYRVDERVRFPILALAAKGDTVWVGSELGLGVTWLGAEQIFVPGDAAEAAMLQEPTVALTFVGDTLAVGLLDRIVWRAPPEPWVAERVVSGELGEITTLAPDSDGIWIGGIRGVAFYRFESRAFSFVNTPGDLPGPVRDIVADDRYLWVATDEGLVRFAKETILR